MLAQEEEQVTTTPGQTPQSDGSRSRGCADLGGGQQAPGRHPHRCPGRAMTYSVNKDSKNEHIVKLIPKSQAVTKWAGRGHRRESGYDNTNNMTRTERPP